MKKIFSFIIFLCLVIMTSCASDGSYTIYLPDGTPALAIANLLDKADDRFKINFVNPTEIASSVSVSNCDMAIMPTISAATLYAKKNVPIKIVSNNVFGSLYLASKTLINDVTNLKGHLIYATAGTTIDMIKYILTKNSIKFNLSSEIKEDEVSITTASSAQEIIPLLAKNSECFGVLGEPVLSNALKKVQDLKIALDIQNEYSKINNNESFPQACFVAKDEMILNHEKVLKRVISLLKDNKEFINESISRISSIYENYNSSLKNINFDDNLIKRCNIDFKMAKEIKTEINRYVYDLRNIELDDDFYY